MEFLINAAYFCFIFTLIWAVVYPRELFDSLTFTWKQDRTADIIIAAYVLFGVIGTTYGVLKC